MSKVNGMNDSNGHVETHLETKFVPDPEEEKRWEKKGVMYQIIMSLCANSSVLGPSMAFGYSGVALTPLMSPTSDVKIDKVQANWIATATALGIPFGCIVSGYTMRRGRKLSLLITSIVSIVGWLVIYLAGTYEQILVGRIISGIATGMASVPATVYSAEVSSPKWRSIMITWTSVSIAIGVLVVYIFGYIFKDDWRMVALMCALFPLVSTVLTLAVVLETPIWLRDRGRLDEALQVLKKFRGIPKDVPPPPQLYEELKPRPQRKKQNFMKHMLKRNAMVPFAILLGYFFFQQFSGLFIIVYYAVDIIQSAGVTIDPNLGAVLIGLTRLVGTLLVSCMSEKLGRRKPSIVSGSAMTIFMGVLSVYLLLKDKGYSINDGGLIPVICILMYIFGSTLGFLVIPFAMVGEVYPTKVKEALSGLTTCINYIFSSITVKTYPDMEVAMGRHGVFIFFTVLSFLGTLFVTFFLPETKGKTLSEIEDMFSRKKEVVDTPEEEKMVDGKYDICFWRKL
ncbi:facilitated trehalose transporter Tret1-2 homolog isoform X1 [Bombus impatiens]|uniref:Facilitated trehalose transporter Tret1-2 homolog isoform X1 n=2 Tax=Bombus impatiens TaxID=132113 RepID=A0A6P6FBK1_BOMIM|nr:facilitated trehalose transporter Tret1-2 homolog isoform X1 [Bombus impatiens]XP_024223946.1 facilitated trehalose transporter Tret1-2 homolog isoform X1 [Bombus impatiens]XP_024223951.1 facilitated trehalose transporter Tret1-2 homolog isoform X1 [Bombus impatiens]